ncbi:MAG: BrnA antitoxin family protein [Rhizobiales bacterium]|nr:BrnA antitoxin family protein [Hyphomicrobiales bacterium]
MTANKKTTRRNWRNPDDAPDLSKPKWRERFSKADVMAGKKVVRRGRPPSESPKVSTTVRLDADVVRYFRAKGHGWQTRLNAALRKVAGL